MSYEERDTLQSVSDVSRVNSLEGYGIASPRHMRGDRKGLRPGGLLGNRRWLTESCVLFCRPEGVSHDTAG